MKTETFISIICQNAEIALQNMKAICARFDTDMEIGIAGNEVLIAVPEGHVLGFSLNALKAVVTQGRVDMFNLEVDADGNHSRLWYCIPA